VAAMTALATSFYEPDHISFYNIVLFLHISAAIVGFGVTFAYPVIDAILRRPGNRKHLAWWHSTQVDVGRKLITTSGTVLLLCGIYLAATGNYDFKATFVTIGLVIIIVILGMGGALFAPAERKMAEVAARDIAAAGEGEITLSAEYEALANRVKFAGITANVLILAGVFVMVMKPS
jgi:uncharacterized membrane protein